MMDCPIFRTEVIREASCEFFIAAESAEEALEAARNIRLSELDDMMACSDYDFTVRPASQVHPRAAHEYGIYVTAIGDWVQSLDDVPQVAPPPDPNQLVMELHEKPVPHLETIKMPGGTL